MIAARRLGASAGALSDALAQGGSGGNEAFRVIAAIADKATSPRFTDYAGSSQAVMAVDTLLNALVREGAVTVGAAAGIRADINRAYSAVRSPASYDAPAFRAALGQAASAYYFLHFLVILPLVSAFETPLPLPSSISESVLHGEAEEAAPAGQKKPRRGATATAG